MTSDLRDKLRQLGVTKGAAQVKPTAQPRRALAIEMLVGGQEIESALGRAFLVQERYAPDHAHGHVTLASLLRQKTEEIGRASCRERV